MNKKIVFLLAFLLLACPLTACGSTDQPPQQEQMQTDSMPAPEAPPAETKQPEQAASDPADAQQPAPVEKETQNPLLRAEFSTADVKSGIGNNIIGKRGYVKINKETLKTITHEQFTEFANTKVADSGLNWVSIICEDGTGICFTGSMSYVADYGTLDEEGGITKQIGVIMLEESGYTYEQTTP